jgi:hypothetical protein
VSEEGNYNSMRSWEGGINSLYLYRDITIQYGPDIYYSKNNIMAYEKHKGDLRRVYKVVDQSPGPEKGKAYYHISPYEDENAVEARIRDKVKSKSAVGGIKAAAKKMNSLGADYQDLFTVKAVSGWLTKQKATELRNSLSKNAKARSGKVYNKISVNKDTNFEA